MTGEITLTGRVLAIGGLREKSMAAYRNGIKTVIIPATNEKDIEEFSPAVKNTIKFVPVKTIDEVFRVAFAEPPKPAKSRRENKKSEPVQGQEEKPVPAEQKQEQPDIKNEGETNEV